VVNSRCRQEKRHSPIEKEENGVTAAEKRKPTRVRNLKKVGIVMRELKSGPRRLRRTQGRLGKRHPIKSGV